MLCAVFIINCSNPLEEQKNLVFHRVKCLKLPELFSTEIHRASDSSIMIVYLNPDDDESNVGLSDQIFTCVEP